MKVLQLFPIGLAALYTIVAAAKTEVRDNGLQIEKLKAGICKRKSSSGDFLKVHYKGTLADTGAVFDQSHARGPFEFQLDAGRVIQGWDQGFQGMCIGEIWKLTIPPDLAYGEAGAGGVIPPSATLIFEVELLGIRGVEPEPFQPLEEEEEAAVTEKSTSSEAPANTDTEGEKRDEL